MNQLYILLLVLWSAFNLSDAWGADGNTTREPSRTTNESHQTLSTNNYPNVSTDGNTWRTDVYGYEPKSDKPSRTTTESHQTLSTINYPNVLTDGNTWRTDVYGYEPKSDKPNITVYRQTEDGEQVIVLCKFGRTYGGQSNELSVESELDYTIKPLRFHPFCSSEMRGFLVTVRPPASFTCVQENMHSQTYNYSLSVSDHHEEGASLLYICFSSFIAVGLFIMTAAVIVINIRSKTKDTNSTAVTDNDYGEA